MSKDYAQIADEVVTGVGLLWQGAPDTANAFGSLSTAATVTKVLDTKTKELMALAIGIAVHCEGCVAYHTKLVHQHGAAREEVVFGWRAFFVPRSRRLIVGSPEKWQKLWTKLSLSSARQSPICQGIRSAYVGERVPGEDQRVRA
jgi:AhpD family alkylhydroperoxidase